MSITHNQLMAQRTPKRPAKPAVSSVSTAKPDIAYKISMTAPETHLLEVEMKVTWADMPADLDLKMPVWTPGSYLVREYSRHVQEFDAVGASGDLRWTKVSKNTWRVITNSSKEVTVRYKVYSNELTVRTNELNDEHAFWNNTALLLYPAGQLAAPSTVKVVPYANWRVATGLPAVAGAENTFRAENFDVLYDSPFEVSDFKEIKFDVLGKPHRYVVTGEGNYDLERLARDTTKIIEAAHGIFGDLPYNDYTFILNLRGGGGLEHMNSTALQANRFAFKPDSRYKGFLALVAHEFFHIWNVKRIKPDALGPFDYENENYTRLLWVAEGVTAYYEGVLMRRAGLVTDEQFLADRARLIKQLEERPGRYETSLEEASFDAWIKYYRQDQNSVNNQISYYDKGEVVAMLLDMSIRTASNGQRSLDDVMRSLYADFGKTNRNFTPADFENAVEKAAGKSLNDFFTRYVSGRSDIDYDPILVGMGLRLEKTGNPKRAYLGADLTEAAGVVTVRALPAGTPAYLYGLNFNDQIVAVDGYRVTQAFLGTYIGERKPGDKIRLTVFRFDKLRDIEVTLGSDPRNDILIVPVKNPTDAQRLMYKNYLNAEL
jgi:predicted metalloprotease with PDZ domain